MNASLTFQTCFGTIVCLLTCAQLYVAATLFRHRRDPLLELSQPIALSMFALSGAVATMGCQLLAVQASDVSCALRQPVLLISISLMGSILVARLWRISCIISPSLKFTTSAGSGSDGRGMQSRRMTLSSKSTANIQSARMNAMQLFITL